MTHFAAIERDVTSRKYHEKTLELRNSELQKIKNELQSTINHRTEELVKSNSRLKRMAYEDALTGLPNRKSFLDQSNQQLARLRRSTNFLGVAILDIDHFKKVNDSFGHDIGDQALQFFASTLRSALRQEDVAGRFGGEEFVVCMISSSTQVIYELLFRFKEEIKQRSQKMVFGPLSVSVGLCCIGSTEDSSITELLKNADIALYQAKDSGRDIVFDFNRGISK